MNKNQPSNITFIITALMLTGLLYGTPSLAQETTLKWHAFEEAAGLAEENRQPVMVDVWAPWCGWCKKMHKEVYPELSETLTRDFVLTRLNRDDNESSLHYKTRAFTPLRLAKKLNVQSVPAIIFLTPEGEYIFHTSGFLEAETLETVLNYVSFGSYKGQSFETYLANIE